MMFSQLNHLYQQVMMYLHLLRFLIQTLVKKQINLIRPLFYSYYNYKVENNSALHNNIFFINSTAKSIIKSFTLNIKFFAFSLYYFFISKLFLICFLQFFVVNRYNDFFSVKISNNTRKRHIFLNFFNHKTLTRHQTYLEHRLLQEYFYILIF